MRSVFEDYSKKAEEFKVGYVLLIPVATKFELQALSEYGAD